MRNLGPTEVATEIKKSKKIWLGTHKGPDGDGLSCQAAFYHTLIAEGYKVEVVHMESLPPRYEFLYEGVARLIDVKKLQLQSDDLVLIFDTHEPTLCEPLVSLADKAHSRVIFIDHHVPHAHSDSLHMGYSDSKAFCTGSLVLKLIDTLDYKIRPMAATCLYTSLVFDTQNFKNVHSQTEPFEMAQRLIENLADTDLVQRNLVDHWSVDKLKFWSRLIDSSEFLENNKLTIIQMKYKDIVEFNLSQDDVNDYIDLFMMVQSIEVAILIREEPDQSYKLSFRSRSHEILSWAQKFEGGGHLFSAGAWVKQSFSEIRSTLNELIKNRESRSSRVS